MSRAEIEQKLGKPVKETPADGATLSTYDLVIDGNEMSAYSGHLGGCVGGCALAMMFIVPVVMVVDATGMFDEETALYVVYGKDDRAMFFGTGEKGRGDIEEFLQVHTRAMQGDVASRNELDMILDEGKSIQDVRLYRELVEAVAPIEAQAEAGDAQAQFRLGKYLGLPEDVRWPWLCRAAHQGHALAAYQVADHFHFGRSPVSQDNVKAYSWYTLSMRFGSPTIKAWSRSEQDYINVLDFLEEEMTPAEVAEAQRITAEWKPNPAECGEPARLSLPS